MKSRPAPLEILEEWVNGEPPLDENCTRLLLAYREALSLANTREKTDPAGNPDEEIAEGESQTSKDVKVTSGEENSSTDDELSGSRAERIAKPPRISSVPRLDDADGVDPGRLSQSHGLLIAMGYLAEELVGRTGGVAYRVTREGIRRLNQEGSADAA